MGIGNIMKELHLTKKDFKLEWFSGQGGGGQHRNKHQNCCRITHIESGLRTQGTSNRERPANQKEAFQKLARMVISWYNADENVKRELSTERVRTYHAEDNRVYDHASGETDSYTNCVDKANIDKMIEARKKAYHEQN